MNTSIYIIDDDSFFRNTYSRVLSTIDNLSVKTFSKGEDALQIIQSEHPDIIILDYNLNRYTSKGILLNGLSVLRKIKSISDEIEVIMMSGEPIINLCDEAIEDGASSFFDKNEFSTSTLKNVIQKLISKKRREIN